MVKTGIILLEVCGALLTLLQTAFYNGSLGKMSLCCRYPTAKAVGSFWLQMMLPPQRGRMFWLHFYTVGEGVHLSTSIELMPFLLLLYYQMGLLLNLLLYVFDGEMGTELFCPFCFLV